MSEPETLDRNSIRGALDDVAQSGRQLLVNQFALIGAEAKEGLDHAVNRLIEAIIAILLGFSGFAVLTVAVIRLLEGYLTQQNACAIVGGLYMVIAVILARLSAGKHVMTGKGG
jgi:hypothetical protein